MAETTASFGIEPDIVRARLTLTKTHSPQRSAFDLVVHPGPSETLSRFLENVQFHPADGERVSFLEMPSGGIIGWSRQSDEEPVRFRVTSGTSWTPDEIRFWVSDQPLNEFGFIYLALYIAGNYARYFPDLWMRDVERSSQLALVIEELLAMAADRMPLLALSVLERVYFVPAR
jgi:hypothetical protein